MVNSLTNLELRKTSNHRVEKTNFSAFFDEGAQNKAEEKEEWGETDIDVIRHPCKSVWKPFESVCILLYFFITAWYNILQRICYN